MKRLIALLSLAAAFRADGQTVLAEYDWAQAVSRQPILGGEVRSADGQPILLVANTNRAGLRTQLLVIERPPITGNTYVLRGEVKYDGVEGDGFLEMWNFFPPEKEGGAESQYFSRTLGLSGVMGKITGTSGWRPIALPFDRTGTPSAPSRLEVNLVLPGAGTVQLKSLRLIELPSQPSAGPVADAWWTERTGAWVGAIGGSAIGCLGGLIGFLASRRQARPFVMATLYLLIGLGALSALAGSIAFATRQPYAVWFPLVLVGVLLLTILPFRLRDLRRGYEEAELRKMMANDAVQS